MKDGFGSPYVKVYSSLGEITSRITDFNYKYSQEADDTCQLRIEELDTDLPDRPEFQEGAILSVIWGYIGEDEKAARKVVITNIKVSYTETTIALDLLCTDKASRIKATSSKTVHKGNVVSIAKDIAEKNGLRYEGISEDGKSLDVSEIIGIAKPGFFDNNGNYTIAVDNTAVPKQINFRLYDVLPQANRSDFHALKDAADGDPNGPLEVYGRDDALIVRPKNLNQKPLKTYTYADGSGLLLSFFPETKNLSRKQSASNINIDAFNPEDKTAYNINTNDFTNGMAKLGDTTDVPARFENSGLPDSTDAEVIQKKVNTGPNQMSQVYVYPLEGKPGAVKINADKPQTDIKVDKKSLRYQLDHPANTEVKKDPKFKKPKADVLDGNFVLNAEYGIVHFVTYNTAAPGFFNKDGIYTEAIDATAVVIPHGTTFTYNRAVDNNKNIPSPEHSLEEAYGKGSNAQADASLKKNPAELEVVGDPLLESGKIVAVLNVSKKYSGNYYIEECTHSIPNRGPYKTTMKLSKNALGSTSADTPSKVAVNSLTIPKTNKKIIINKQINPEELKGKSLMEQLKIIGPEKPIVK
jgi:hypothetical protein